MVYSLRAVRAGRFGAADRERDAAAIRRGYRLSLLARRLFIVSSRETEGC